jgi:hypothetical protein
MWHYGVYDTEGFIHASHAYQTTGHFHIHPGLRQ